MTFFSYISPFALTLLTSFFHNSFSSVISLSIHKLLFFFYPTNSFTILKNPYISVLCSFFQQRSLCIFAVTCQELIFLKICIFYVACPFFLIISPSLSTTGCQLFSNVLLVAHFLRSL